MFKMAIILLMLIFNSGIMRFVWAGRDISPNFGFDFSSKSFILGMTVEALNSGAAVSHIKNENVIEPGQPFEVLLKKSLSDAETKLAGIGSEIRKLKAEIKGRSISQPASISRQAHISFVIPYNPDEFIKCAKSTSLLIKQLIKINHGFEDASSMQVRKLTMSRKLIEKQIRATRGDGTQIGIDGVACGCHLGAAGFKTKDILEDLKILSIFSRRTDKEFDLLLTTAIAAFHNAASPIISRVWRKYWDILAIEAAFGTNPLPTLDDFKPLLPDLVFDVSLYGLVPIQLTEVDQITAEGEAFAEKLKKDLKL